MIGLPSAVIPASRALVHGTFLALLTSQEYSDLLAAISLTGSCDDLNVSLCESGLGGNMQGRLTVRTGRTGTRQAEGIRPIELAERVLVPAIELIAGKDLGWRAFDPSC